ncbi:hypothetical protein [Oceanobacillus massiliensis]|uniref:hypothetical protein n=1 Tax=Oceanobacillus massiliensis TaxID=1465765 RepID=UPI0030167871
MSRYLKLVNFELNRFIKIYMVLIGITIVSQITGVFISARRYLSIASEKTQGGSMSIDEFLNQYGFMSFADVARSLWFVGPIFLCVVSLLIYMFFIWYRDWFGKNTFIYRLLMLPTARINVFLAKATTIFMLVLGLIALQLVLIPIENYLFQWMVPVDFRTDMPVQHITSSLRNFYFMFPQSFTEFMIIYGIGLMAVCVVFTAILIERSYRWKGIIVGILYGAAALLLFFLPVILQETILYQFFYPMELFVLQLVTGIIVLTLSIVVSHFLLTKKIRI